jgi:molybdopterin-guanine dinucleotide biosynthesis protein A
MGGQSTRMGSDKSQLEVSSSVPSDLDVSRTTFAQLARTKLKCYVDEVYFSINKDQQNLDLENTILDEYENEGPLSGIISALRATQASILVLGVDMPLVKKQTIKNLIKHRNWDLLTTTYYDDKNAKWEPMLSIWEIETLPALEKYFDAGGRSIQNFLNQFGNQRVQIDNPEEFKNVNTMEEYQALITN